MNQKLIELQSWLMKICEKAVAESSNIILVSTRGQVEYVLRQYLSDLPDLYHQTFKPALNECVNNSGKSLDNAKRYKSMANIYRHLSQAQFIDKAIDQYNKAIQSVPHDHSSQMIECFAQRSNLHYQKDDYTSALRDIEHALEVRGVVSYSLVERKVNILCKLNRLNEAYDAVCDAAHSHLATTNQHHLVMFKKLKKHLKNAIRVERGKISEHAQSSQHSNHDNLIEMDHRIELQFNPTNKRYEFVAIGDIGNVGVQLINESPIMLTHSAKCLLKYCDYCSVKVDDTFWPCGSCIDVVYCSRRCQEEAWGLYHEQECGMVNCMLRQVSNQALSVYRTFVKAMQYGLSDIQHNAKTFRLDHCLKTETRGPETDSRARSPQDQWFLMSQVKMFERIAQQKPMRRPHELCHSILLFMVYCYKMNIEPGELSVDDLVRSVEFIAYCLVQTQINEFGWTELNEHNDKLQIGYLQCLFGSNLTHECEPNCIWGFDDGLRFRVKSTKPINAGQCLSISYVDLNQYSYFKRQLYLQSYFTLCKCERCMSDLHGKHLAIRCEYCHGAVPYHSQQFNNRVCVNCNQIYDSGSIMPVIEHEFNVASKLVCLIGLVQDRHRDEELVQFVENVISTLVGYVYLRCDLLIAMVNRLCDQYMHLKHWHSAVQWFEWFKNTANVDLCCSNSGDQQHQIIECYKLAKWINAYLHCLDDVVTNQQHDCFNVNYVKTVSQLLERRFKMLQTLHNGNGKSKFLDVLDDIQVKSILKTEFTKTQNSYEWFRSICLKIIKHGHGGQTQFNWHNDGEIASLMDTTLNRVANAKILTNDNDDSVTCDFMI